MIDKYINIIIDYGIKNNLMDKLDEIYVRNRLLDLFELDEYENIEKINDDKINNLDEILNGMLEFAIKKGLINDTIAERDLFDSRIMGEIVKRPSDIVREFSEKYNKSPQNATDYYYKFSKNSNYIRESRVKKDLKWKVDTEFGLLDITVNMSKPEKDPKDIEKALKEKSSNYPKCLLCKECEGYRGRLTYPSRSNHRLIPIKINNSNWYLQYSPYIYFNEHSIVLKELHAPMQINKDTFIELLDFIDKFKHYFIGSNADLPIVGGSILSHNHYQAGNYKFTIEEAKEIKSYKIKDFDDIKVTRVKWPLSVIRISSVSKERLISLADLILKRWRAYSDESVDILAFGGKIPHNTITPIARFRNGEFELDLVLRNNRKTDEHAYGIFHPHDNLHHIKKENIGLIEVMGLAVLPARLNLEIQYMKEYLLGDFKNKDKIKSHIEWLDFLIKNREFDKEDLDFFIKKEIGIVFLDVLKDCGVFKLDNKGDIAFEKFIDYVNL